MEDGPSAEDRAFLARLNAIKPSKIVPSDDGHGLPSMRAESTDRPEDLIARFQKMHGRRTTDSDEVDTAQNPSHHNRPASPTIEELLADIGPEEQYTVDETELKEAQKLLTEAQGVLYVQDSKGIESTLPTLGHDENYHPGESKATLTEDQEAESALERILGEHEKEVREHPPAPPPTRANAAAIPSSVVGADSFASLQFPTISDDHFDDLKLPSPPRNAPSAAKCHAEKQTIVATSEEIESWCIICCADAAVQCFGCGKDLYCWGCWREGHMGENAGLEEKAHVWERWGKYKSR